MELAQEAPAENCRQRKKIFTRVWVLPVPSGWTFRQEVPANSLFPRKPPRGKWGTHGPEEMGTSTPSTRDYVLKKRVSLDSQITPLWLCFRHQIGGYPSVFNWLLGGDCYLHLKKWSALLCMTIDWVWGPGRNKAIGNEKSCVVFGSKESKQVFND